MSNELTAIINSTFSFELKSINVQIIDSREQKNYDVYIQLLEIYKIRGKIDDAESLVLQVIIEPLIDNVMTHKVSLIIINSLN